MRQPSLERVRKLAASTTYRTNGLAERAVRVFRGWGYDARTAPLANGRFEITILDRLAPSPREDVA